MVRESLPMANGRSRGEGVDSFSNRPAITSGGNSASAGRTCTRSKIIPAKQRGSLMICQDCGVEAATKYVSFHQNIGALVVHFTKSINGKFCKSCINRHFWGMTGKTFLLGWWGVISFIITPFLLLNNIVRYVFCLGMPAV